MSDYSMADIGKLRGMEDAITATHSTSRKNNTDLTMQDFLQLMVVQLQNQTMDDTMDTSEMMNQMVQMQMVTAMTNMTEASLMSYASSLVGKVVTIGIVNGDTLEEREIEVIGTGVSNGQQVIFGSDNETYGLNQIMAIGRLPELKDPEEAEQPGDNPNENPTDPVTPPATNPAETPEYSGEQGAPTEGTE